MKNEISSAAIHRIFSAQWSGRGEVIRLKARRNCSVTAASLTTGGDIDVISRVASHCNAAATPLEISSRRRLTNSCTCGTNQRKVPVTLASDGITFMESTD